MVTFGERMTMERDDLTTLRSLGFKDDELRELGLWKPATGAPSELAEMYVRRSKKKDTLTSLRQQVREMCGHARSENKTIRHLWFEQRSASKASVRREEFEKSTGAVTDGLSKTLYVYKTSRLSRRGMGQVGLLLDEFDARKARICVTAERIDSSKSRMILAILSEQAREQAADIAQFAKLSITANKAEGKWTGGVAPYGLYSPKGSGKLARNPKEYPTARRIAVYLLNRMTPAWIANKLNGEALLTRHGRKWTDSGIISLAHSVTWAGLVANRERMKDKHGNELDKYHRGGTPLLDKKGHPISLGEGVISFSEHVKISRILADRAQPGTTIGDRSRGKHEIVAILTDILRCGRCKGPMENGGINYRCQARQRQGESSCKGISTDRARIDKEIAGLWETHILSLSPESDVIHAIARKWLDYKDPAKEKRKQEVTAALESAASRELKLQKEFFLGGGMNETLYDSLRRELSEQISAMKAELKELAKSADLTTLVHPEPLALLWEGAGASGQRALLRAAMRKIILSPPKGRGDRTPLHKRLEIDWIDKAAGETPLDKAFAHVEKSRIKRTAA
ncbi:recombinase family protein [Streptomyces sp. NBC_01233]|uniref:recombinase family protein n=1 Tax=Streptomyces sp. NBC_01233 TaxID=2903787 RepID=UPI002E0EDC42|nr:recombinase family protein [Streptomyces sp. NBC_01233]